MAYAQTPIRQVWQTACIFRVHYAEPTIQNNRNKLESSLGYEARPSPDGAPWRTVRFAPSAISARPRTGIRCPSGARECFLHHRAGIGEPMLRVTVQNDELGATFKLEGKLAHEWVAEAEKAWLAFSETPRQERIVVDLCAVSFVDDSGRDLLVRMHASGAKLVGTGLTTSALIKEICSEPRRPGPNWMHSLLSLLFLAQVGALAHKNEFLNLVRAWFPARLVYSIPGWLLSLQSCVSVFWKGLFQ